MCKKYHIGSTTYQKIIDNMRPSKPTEKWHKIIDSVNISSQVLEDNQESSQSENIEQVSLKLQCNADTSSTNILENRSIHTEDVSQNSKNSINLNFITNGQKDRISQKKKSSIKTKDNSFPA
ncbi:hypothetical protein RclHR1_14280011 [Rhizophagus clarus]|uniref:Uncharacterized protein n=1 Tax=Rhizophagus clarus TaxID=94130 RepID=A0A2Z6QC62_9GLOM|nr:hypothetical protein RclHR1_14280011 [Rhizophagus clarus]GES91399.1 hypothetical protein GLOIN_2v1798835 [Rhizophagus clarus]